MPKDDATTERLEGPTPAGGAYAICYYAHDGQPVSRRFANQIRIVEYDAVGQVVHTTWGRITPDEELPRTGRRKFLSGGMRWPRMRRSAETATPAETATCANCERIVYFDDGGREDSAVVEFLPSSGTVTTLCPACADIESQWRETGIHVGDRPPFALKNARPLSPQQVREMFGGSDDDASSSHEVDEALRLAWDNVDRQFVRRTEDPHPRWNTERDARHRAENIRMVRAARAKPELARLFPFEVNGQLCLSRCSSYPWTTDCPCIGSYVRDGEYLFYVFTEPFPEPEGPPEVPLVVTPDLEVALQTMNRHLPSDQTVWIGSANDR